MNKNLQYYVKQFEIYAHDLKASFIQFLPEELDNLQNAEEIITYFIQAYLNYTLCFKKDEKTSW